jgi:glutathione S-transferase
MFPKAKLAPLDDAFAFAQAQSFNNYLCATVHVAHAHKGRGYRWATDESSFADMKRTVPKSMAGAFELIEKGLLKGPWVMGDQYTVCDGYLYTVALWLEGDSVDLKTLPRVADHMKRMSERPAVKKVMGEQQAKAA